MPELRTKPFVPDGVRGEPAFRLLEVAVERVGDDFGSIVRVGKAVEAPCGFARPDDLDVGGAPAARRSVAIGDAVAVGSPTRRDPGATPGPRHAPEQARQDDQRRVERRTEEENRAPAGRPQAGT